MKRHRFCSIGFCPYPNARISLSLAAFCIAFAACNANQRAGSLPSTVSQSVVANDSSRTLGKPGAKSPYGVLYNFGSKENDGLQPQAALIMSKNGGLLYGTTVAGGSKTFGAIVEVAPAQNRPGTYTAKNLWNFTNTYDGGDPRGTLTLVNGNLYGTTSTGGYGYGTLFWLDSTHPQKIHVLHTFTGGTDGATPMAGLAYGVYAGGDRELYGTTAYGGSGTCQAPSEPAGCGTLFVYDLTTKKYSQIYSFAGTDGAFPLAGLIVPNGACDTLCVAGTTSQGGSNSCPSPWQGCGTAFLMADVSGTWEIAKQYSFEGPPHDGFYPVSSLVHLGTSSQDNFAGTTKYGGSTSSSSNGYGTVFEINGFGPSDVVIHSFDPYNNNDGSQPLSGLVLNSKGALFGTTQAGGTNSEGSAYKIGSKSPYTYNRFWDYKLAEGIYPAAGFTVGTGSNPPLFGTTSGGGTKNHGGGVANIFHNEF